MIKAVLLDYDDILVQSQATRITAYIETAKKFYNLILTETDVKKHWGKPYEQFVSDLFQHIKPAEEIIKNFRQFTASRPLPAYPGAVDFVNTLLDSYVVAVSSGSRKDMLFQDIIRLGFPVDRLFDIQTGDDILHHKPDPRFFDSIMEKLTPKNISRGETIYIGNNLIDYQSASSAGLRFLAIADRTDPPSVFEQNQVDYVLNFPKVIDKIKLF